MHMQRQHWQRETNDQESDRDHAHDREQRGHRMAVSNGRAQPGAALCSAFLITVDALARSRGTAFVRFAATRGRRVYRLILKHGHIYRD